MSAYDWHDQGACQEFGSGLFTASDEDGPALKGTATAVQKQAAAICARCPVMERCLEFAMAAEGTLTSGARAGVYGGMTPIQRYRLHLERSRTALAVAA